MNFTHKTNSGMQWTGLGRSNFAVCKSIFTVYYCLLVHMPEFIKSSFINLIRIRLKNKYINAVIIFVIFTRSFKLQNVSKKQRRRCIYCNIVYTLLIRKKKYLKHYIISDIKH